VSLEVWRVVEVEEGISDERDEALSIVLRASGGGQAD
jgi:hypothetical protein